MSGAAAPRAVLFDLGGVLAEVSGLGSVGAMRQLSGIDSDEALWQRWLTCPWVRRFERGGCTPEEFAAGLVAEWALPVRPSAFLESFRSWLAVPMDGAEELVAEIAGRVPVLGCLSNTNALHWDERMSRWPMMERFEHRFLSFELGLLKPDPEIFQRAVAEIGLPAREILFLDDNPLNVEAAGDRGLRVARVQGVAEARRALVAAGVL